MESFFSNRMFLFNENSPFTLQTRLPPLSFWQASFCPSANPAHVIVSSMPPLYALVSLQTSGETRLTLTSRRKSDGKPLNSIFPQPVT